MIESPRVDEDDVLAGYSVIECRAVDEVVEIAACVLDAATSKVVVHPLLDLDPVPTGPRAVER